MADNKQVVDYILNVQVGTAKRDLNQLAGAADKSSKNVDELGDESKRSALEVSKLGKKSKKSGKDILGAFSKAANVVTGLQAAFSMAGSAYRVFNAALRSGFDITRDTVDNINQLNDASARSGLSAGGVQAVIQAFEGAGMSAQTAEAFISRLPRQLSDLADSSTSAAQAYQLLGGNIRDAQGNVKDADTLLRELTHNFQNMTDGGQRALVAFEVFGRSAGSFLQAFGATAEFDKFLDFSEEFGVNVDKGGKEAAIFQEALAALSIQAKGLAQAFVLSTGGMKAFNDGMRSIIIGMAQVKGFLDAGSEGIQLFGRQLIAVAHVAINDIFIRSLNLMTDNLAGWVVGINNFIAATTDRDFLGEITEDAGVAALSFYDLDSALSAGVESGKKAADLFDGIVKGLELSTAETAKMEAQLKKLFDQLGGTGEEAEGTGKKAVDMAGMIKDANGIISDSNSDLLTEQDKIEQNYHSLIEKIDEYANAGMDAAKAAKARAAIERRAFRDLEKHLNSLDAAAKQEFEIGLKLDVADFEEAAGAFASALSSPLKTTFTRMGEELGRTVELDFFKSQTDARVSASADIGGIIASSILAVGGFLSNLGRKTESEIRAEFEGTARAIAKGLEVLPAILIDILPDAIGIGMNEVIKAIRQLPTAITLEFLNRIFNRGGPSGDRGGGLFEGIGAAMAQVAAAMKSGSGSRNSLMGGGPFIPSAANGIRFTGSNRGLAMLHEGETVIPRSGRTSQATERNLAGFGGGITININASVVEGNAIDYIVREMEQRFRTFGQGTSPLFAG